MKLFILISLIGILSLSGLGQIRAFDRFEEIELALTEYMIEHDVPLLAPSFGWAKLLQRVGTAEFSGADRKLLSQDRIGTDGFTMNVGLSSRGYYLATFFYKGYWVPDQFTQDEEDLVDSILLIRQEITTNCFEIQLDEINAVLQRAIDYNVAVEWNRHYHVYNECLTYPATVFLLKVEWLPYVQVAVMPDTVHVERVKQFMRTFWAHEGINIDSFPRIPLPFDDAITFLNALIQQYDQAISQKNQPLAMDLLDQLSTRILQLTTRKLSVTQADILLNLICNYNSRILSP